MQKLLVRVLGVFFSLPVVLLGFCAGKISLENVSYARSFFDGLAPVSAVLASRRWHPLSGGIYSFDCTYAIVRLDENAPHDPPTAIDGREWNFWFGGGWLPTPAKSPRRENDHDTIHECADHFGPALAAELGDSLAQPGSWYVSRGGGEETLDIWSPTKRLAAHIRIGD